MGHSPTVTPKTRPSDAAPLMTFPEAMAAVITGKKVAREAWENSDYLALDKPGYLNIHKEDEETAALLVSDGDMLNDDWVIVNHH